MSIEESIETLKYFGLSPNQAKVYLNIGSTKFFSVNEIQKKAEVPRQEIYRILFVLEEFGLVEKTVDRPIRFRGIPFKQGVTFLLEKRVQETNKMIKRTYRNQRCTAKPPKGFRNPLEVTGSTPSRNHFSLVTPEG